MKGRGRSNRTHGGSIWPRAIIGTFVVFISAIAAWITFAVRQDMDLVASDYYEREILFQREIDAAQRARSTGGVSVAYNAQQQQLTVRLPKDQLIGDGVIHLYRPSNASLDRQIKLEPRADGTQVLDTRHLARGLWKVRLSWTVNSQGYQFSQPVVIAGNT